eukprot:4579443-Amphidinium_carterae.1
MATGPLRARSLLRVHVLQEDTVFENISSMHAKIKASAPLMSKPGGQRLRAERAWFLEELHRDAHLAEQLSNSWRVCDDLFFSPHPTGVMGHDEFSNARKVKASELQN